MTTFVGANAGITTATPPTHQVGDFFIVKAFRDGSTTPPTPPTGEGWVPLTQAGAWPAANTCSAVAFCKIADSTSENVGTFLNATLVEVSVWRPAAGKKLRLGTWVWTTGNASSVTYASTILIGFASTSWVAVLAGHRSINTNLQTPPTGWSNRSNYLDGVNEGAIHDSNGPLASWAGQAIAVGGTAAGWITLVVEIRETTSDLEQYEAGRDDPVNNALGVVIGHSLAAGACSTGNGMGSNAISGSWPTQLAQLMTACRTRSSDDSFFGEQNSAAFSTPGAFNTNLNLGTFTPSGTAGVGGKVFVSVGASTFSFTPDHNSDRATIFVLSYPGSPQFTVNVNGGSTITTLTMNAANAISPTTISFTNGANQLRWVSGAANGYVVGAIMYEVGVKQLTLLNCSFAGALCSDYLVSGTPFSPIEIMRGFGARAVTLIHLDANEIMNGVALETFRFQHAVLILESLAFGSVVVISSAFVSPAATGISEATQTAYHDAIEAWATVMGCGYVRGTAQPGLSTFAAGNALGLYDGDGIHMPAAGYYVAYVVPLLAMLDTASGPVNTPVSCLTDAGASARLVKGAFRFISATTTPVPTKQSTLSRALLVTAGAAGSLARSIGKLARAETTPPAALAKALGKVLAAVTTPQPALTRLIGKRVQATTTPLSILGRNVNKPLLATTTPQGVLARAVAKVLGVTTTPAPTEAHGSLRSQSIDASTTPVPTMTQIRVKLVTVLGITTPVPTLQRAMAKPLQAVTTPAPTVRKQLARTLLAAAAVAASLSRSMARVALVTSTPVPSLARAMARVLAAVTTPQGRLSRLLGKNLQATSTPTPTVAQIRVRLVSALVTTAPQGSVRKTIGKPLQAIATGWATLVKIKNQVVTRARVRVFQILYRKPRD